MEYTGDYISKPVVGKAAEELAHAIQTGGYVANDRAIETVNRIVEQRKKEKSIDGSVRQGRNRKKVVLNESGTVVAIFEHEHLAEEYVRLKNTH